MLIKANHVAVLEPEFALLRCSGCWSEDAILDALFFPRRRVFGSWVVQKGGVNLSTGMLPAERQS